MSNNLRNNMIRALYSSPLRLALLGLLLLAGVTNARADDVNFLLTDGVHTMTWTLPSNPTPNGNNSSHFNVNGVSVLEDGITTVSSDIFFYNLTGNDGGISNTIFNTFDYQTFSGTTLNPMFVPGTYAEPATEDEATVNEETDTWAFSGSNDVPNLTLTITAPEPSSMLLLSSGLLGLMGMGLYKKRLA